MISIVHTYLALVLSFQAGDQAQNSPCPRGLSVHAPTGLCMWPATQSYVNCVTALTAATPHLKEIFTKTLQANSLRIPGRLSLGLVLRQAEIDAAFNETQQKEQEASATYAPIDTGGCNRPPPPPPPPVTPRDRTRPSPAPEAAAASCDRLTIAKPFGATSQAHAGHFTVTRPFEVTWTPVDCPAIVAFASELSGASGMEVNPAAVGDMQIRLLSPADRRELAKEWVHVLPPATTPPPDPTVRITSSANDVNVQLIDKDGHSRAMTLGAPQPVAPGEYRLRWSNAASVVPLTIKSGNEYLAHQEALRPPAKVLLLPPTGRSGRVTAAGGLISTPQRYTLEPPPAHKLALNVADGERDLANVQLAQAPEGGVQLEIEPTAPRRTYAPLLIGGGGAAVAGLLWAFWLRPAANEAQDNYDNLGPGDDFAAARGNVNAKTARANVALWTALTSLVVGGALEGWEIYKESK